jgi:NAD(P)-dependent dehydrogenase (short-subunit alcohol dehydrogenase family)
MGPLAEGGHGMKRLTGKKALVTGAGQGIGRAIALAFVREGASVAAADLVPESAASTLEALQDLGGQGLSLPGDVGRLEDCERMVTDTVEAFGGLDIVVNAAAWADVGPRIADVTEELYARTMDVCLGSVFRICRAAYPHLKVSGSASVINFASSAGSEGMAGNTAYAAAKEGIRGLSRSLALEWGRDGIRVNMIRPIALSPSMAGWAEAYPKVAAAQAAMIPLRRFGDCDTDVAPVAVFLASEEARYLTAVTLPVDGGGGKER